MSSVFADYTVGQKLVTFSVTQLLEQLEIVETRTTNVTELMLNNPVTGVYTSYRGSQQTSN